jgi:hypothetical protein
MDSPKTYLDCLIDEYINNQVKNIPENNRSEFYTKQIAKCDEILIQLNDKRNGK